MDRSLDDIVSERHTRGPRGRRGGGGRRNDRTEYPRDGIRKVQIPPSSILLLSSEVSYMSSQHAITVSIPAMVVENVSNA